MPLITDVQRTVQAAQAAFGAVRSIAEWYDTLAPLRDASLRGDRTAYQQLQAYANDPDQLPAMRAAARLLVEEVNVRKQIGTTATKIGVASYPGQLSPVALGLGVLVLFLLIRRRG